MQLPFQKSHAFLIGINDYQNVSPLQTAVNDAEALANKLEEDHGYIIHGPLLNPTKKELEVYVEKVIKTEVGKEDRVLFYFAGHGIALDSKKGPKGYLVPIDAKSGEEASLYPMKILHDALTDLPCRHGLLVLDCCFSGAFKWSSGRRDIIFDLPGIIYEQRLYQYLKDPAWQVITSSASDQKAVDVLEERSLGFRGEIEEEHSPFARALMDGISGEADMYPQERGDGVITTTELYTFLRDRVEDLTMSESKRQSPSLFSLKKHDKGQYIFLHPRHPLNLPSVPDRNPFMGLKSFDESDASLFYGRDRVVNKLKLLVDAEQFVVVSGASGTGKSSVIKAGLLPKLRKEGWKILPIIRPGLEPLENLAIQIPDIKTAITTQEKIILVIDQYEELITRCLEVQKKEAFETKMVNWLTSYPNLKIIISVRADFEPQFKKSPLATYWVKGRYNVPTFSNDELREIIIKPTIQEVLFFDPDSLVEDLIDEVNQAPGALPLLSFTLSELYYAYLNSGRTNRSLTDEDYLKLGGVIGALHTRADKMYHELDDAHQNSMQQLMLRMVSVEGGEYAGKRILAEDLQFTNPAETKRVQTVVNTLVNARLIQKGSIPKQAPNQQDEIFIEPAHDALMRAWPLLREWVKKVGEDKLAWQNKLSIAINDYEEMLHEAPQKAKNLLWHENPRLTLLKVALTEKGHGFNQREEQFVKKSLQLKTRKFNQFVGGLILIALTGFILAGIAFSFYSKSENTLTELREKQAENVIEKSKGFVNKGRAYFLEFNFDAAIKEFDKVPEVISEYKKNFNITEDMPASITLNLHRADSLKGISQDKNRKKEAFKKTMEIGNKKRKVGMEQTIENSHLFFLEARTAYQKAIDIDFDRVTAQNAYNENELSLKQLKADRIKAAEEYLSYAKSLNDKDLFQKAYENYKIADTIQPLDSLTAISLKYAEKRKS